MTNERVIPEAAVEEVAAILYDIGEHQNTHTFEAVHDMLREDAKRILEAAAPHIKAQALESAAQEFHARLPDGTGNGRAYNSHQVARILRERTNGND